MAANNISDLPGMIADTPMPMKPNPFSAKGNVRRSPVPTNLVLTDSDVGSDRSMGTGDEAHATPRTAKRLKANRSGEAVESVPLSSMAKIEKLLEVQIRSLDSFKAAAKSEIGAVRSVCDERAERAVDFEEEIMDRLERDARKCDLVFRGIPVGPTADIRELQEIVLNLATFLSVVVTERDIVFVRKVFFKKRGTNHDAILVVRFNDQVVRRNYLMAFIKAKTVTMQALGFETTERITVADNLTRRNSAIRQRAVTLKSDGIIEWFNIRDGLIVIMFKGKRHTIKSLNELNAITKNVDN